MTYLVLSILFATLAAICRSVEHILIHHEHGKYDRSIFVNWPEWWQHFLLHGSEDFQTLDGFHIFGGLNDFFSTVSGVFLAISAYFNGFLFITISPAAWFTYYYFVFNLCYHNLMVTVKERTVVECIPVLGYVWRTLQTL